MRLCKQIPNTNESTSKVNCQNSIDKLRDYVCIFTTLTMTSSQQSRTRKRKDGFFRKHFGGRGKDETISTEERVQSDEVRSKQHADNIIMGNPYFSLSVQEQELLRLIDDVYAEKDDIGLPEETFEADSEVSDEREGSAADNYNEPEAQEYKQDRESTRPVPTTNTNNPKTSQPIRKEEDVQSPSLTSSEESSSELYRIFATFFTQIYNLSKDESTRLLTNIADAYNISTEQQDTFNLMTLFSGAYTISKVESFRILTKISNIQKTLSPRGLTNGTSIIEASNNNISNKATVLSSIPVDQDKASPEKESWSTLPLITVFILFLIFIWLFRKYRKSLRKLQSYEGSATENNQTTELNGMEGMKILRSSRMRSSTYDFFGMHLNQARERGNSLDDLGRDSSPFDNRSPPQIRRERVGSMDIFYSKAMQKQNLSKSERRSTQPTSQLATQDFVKSQIANEEGEEEGFLYDEFGLVTLSFDVVYYGPLQQTLDFSALTPPRPWTEASRQIIPKGASLRLKRNIRLDVSKGSVLVQEPNSKGQWDYQFATDDVSLYIVSPPAGGVVKLYKKGAPTEEWKEFTFETSQSAAQFQLDLLAYQVLGKILHNMFEALCILHQGSMAYNGQEFVLHQHRLVEEGEESKGESNLNPHYNVSCATWDDAMRCLSSIPTIRIALERLWLSHRRPSDDSKGKSSLEIERDGGLITEEYANRRVLLGPADFFRLFVPVLPDSAIPQTGSNRLRMEQLLSWRKRAARATVLVRAYVNSRQVVNLGWDLFQNENPPEQGHLQKRLSYDDNEDNMRRDSNPNSKNEYYEASVSRDVLCHVRPFDFFSIMKAKGGMDAPEQSSLVLSPYQAYTLVGMHIFKSPEDTEESSDYQPLDLFRDPVDTLPSLNKLISENPDLDFVVLSFFNSENTVCVACYVRSLAKGIDPKFDNVIDRFTHGRKELRDRKVQLMIQLGQHSSLSFGGWMFLRALSIHLGFMKGRESPLLGLEMTKDRFPLPSMRLADYAETHHFGGSMQSNPALPKNYVSMTASFETFLPNVVARFFFYLVEKKLFARAIDFTFILEGEQDDELPERALCTTRAVQLDSKKGPVLPPHCYKEPDESSRQEQENSSRFRPWARLSVQNAFGFFSPHRVTDDTNDEIPQVEGDDASDDSRIRLSILGSKDPLERATDDVIDVLDGIQVPSQRGYPDDCSSLQGTSGVSALHSFCRKDIQYFLASVRGDVKEAALKLLETATWKAKTFPVDILRCRIELQSGQFFSQGTDLKGNPVFYFRNLCLGPWRNDVNASIAAVIHRFNKTMTEFLKEKPSTKCTVILLMGRPMESGNFIDVSEEFDIGGDSFESDDEEDSSYFYSEGSESEDDETTEGIFSDDAINPRIPPDETWCKHTSKELIHKVRDLLIANYPGRLHRILVVQGKGKNRYYSNALQRRRVFKTLLPVKSIREKVRFIDEFSDLCKYVDRDELVTIVGGTSRLKQDVFDCN